MPAPGRVLKSDFSGSRIPPVPVPSNARAPFEVLRGLGRRLAARREQRGLTCRELADLMNYPYSAVVSIEHGLKPGPRTFWVLADRALDANRALLADADESLLVWAAAMQEDLRRRHELATKTEPTRPTLASATDRVFASHLGATAIQGY